MASRYMGHLLFFKIMNSREGFNVNSIVLLNGSTNIIIFEILSRLKSTK